MSDIDEGVPAPNGPTDMAQPPGLRVLAQQAEVLHRAVADATQGTQIALNEYRAGTVDYTTVATAQTAQLNNQQSLLSVEQQRRLTAVSLIGNLGGGWSADALQDTAAKP